MKTYIITEDKPEEVIAKIVDNINAKARKTGVSLTSVAESVRQAIKFNIKKNSETIDSNTDEIHIVPCKSLDSTH